MNASETHTCSLTHVLYWLSLSLKCRIQFPRFFSVSGANRRHPFGICPLKRHRAMSSNSLDIPTSPANAYKETFIV